jgi:hypothetical protein
MLVAQEGQGEVDALDLAEPAFGFDVLTPEGSGIRARPFPYKPRSVR